MRPWASCSLSILCLPYHLCPRVGREKPTLPGNLERDCPSGFCIRKAKLRRLDWEGLGLRALPCPPNEGGDKPALPPLAQSPGNLFPGPGRLSKPWPAQPQCCWLRFPHFLVFSSPCCPRRCLLSGPAPTRPELDPREGECWKGGQGGGTGDREAA